MFFCYFIQLCAKLSILSISVLHSCFNIIVTRSQCNTSEWINNSAYDASWTLVERSRRTAASDRVIWHCVHFLQLTVRTSCSWPGFLCIFVYSLWLEAKALNLMIIPNTFYFVFIGFHRHQYLNLMHKNLAGKLTIIQRASVYWASTYFTTSMN